MSRLKTETDTLALHHNNIRNNFIVGQVTPDMLAAMPYGTYILFGLLTYLGAAFIWFFVPETKRLSLEEMVRIFLSPSCYPPLPFSLFFSSFCLSSPFYFLSLSILPSPAMTYHPIYSRTSSLAPRVLHKPTLSACRKSTAKLASTRCCTTSRLPPPLASTRAEAILARGRRRRLSRKKMLRTEYKGGIEMTGNG